MAKCKFSCDCDAVHTELVNATAEQMPDNAVFYGLESFYKVLADSTRCKILFALQQNEMCVCDLSKLLNMTKSAVSHQLAKMRLNGVVKCRRSGKEVYYSLDDEHVSEIFAVTVTHICHKIDGVEK